jgi:leucyl-tRNA synthetase
VQERWLPVWDRLDLYRAGAREAEKKYVLDMFPYPSGDLHMGHAEAYGPGGRAGPLLDAPRLRRAAPDRLGLLRPAAENAAIKRDQHPAEYTYANIETQAESFRRYAISFDWSRRLHTSDPEYYRWTQWLFLRFRERGLAYRKSSAVNWCPKDQTVLANEQVVQGACERCGTVVTKRELTQWFFKVTDYADRLLDDMEQLRGSWPERVLLMQRSWIGQLAGRASAGRPGRRPDGHRSSPTRPDTLYGPPSSSSAADAPLALELCDPSRREELETYRDESQALRHRPAGDDREDRRRPGRHGAEPVPASRSPSTPRLRAGRLRHRRDLWPCRARPARPRLRRVRLPVRVVVDTGGADPSVGCRHGRRRRAGEQRAVRRAAQGRGDRARRRRPGARGRRQGRHQLPAARLAAVAAALLGRADPDRALPSCGEVPVPDDQLPVRLPDLRGAALKPAGTSPLGQRPTG